MGKPGAERGPLGLGVMVHERLGETLHTIYGLLLSRYGPQHWWPGDSPFEVAVGAILTQSTAWANVEKAIARMKLEDALDPAALRRLPLSDIASFIRSSGYYNAKARKLQAFALWLGERCGDEMGRLSSWESGLLRQELLAVYGIGEETADSILLYAAGKPVFVIDAYTRRIVQRLGLAPGSESYAALQSLFMANLPLDVAYFNEYHALLVRHGKEACHKRPLCQGCCLRALCPYQN